MEKAILKAVNKITSELFGIAPKLSDVQRVEWKAVEGKNGVSLLISVDGSSYCKIFVDTLEVKYAAKAEEIKTACNSERRALIRCSDLGKVNTSGRGETNAEKYTKALDKLHALILEWEAKEKELKDKIKAIPETQKAKIKAAEESLLKNTDKYQTKIEEANQTVEELYKIKDEVQLGETQKSVAKQLFLENELGRKRIVDAPQLRKGIYQELKALEILSEFDGYTYIKNNIRLIDEELGLIGEMDAKRKHEDGTLEILDTKLRYDAHSFFSQKAEEQNKSEADQLDGYLILYPQATRATIVNVLVNNTDDEIRRAVYLASLKYKDGEIPKAEAIKIIKEQVFDFENFVRLVGEIVGVIGEDVDALEEFESFREIPLNLRVLKVSRERDEERLEATKANIKKVREYAAREFGVII